MVKNKLFSPLVQFNSYLKAFYSRQKFPNYEKWPPCSSKKYINLACIEKEKISKKMSNEFTKASIHGNIDDIVCEKHPMEFHQIAKMDEGSWPKLILVEGAPGVGKSTFAWKLCRKWCKGKILSQYKLVVLLRLKDKHVRESKTLYDLIYYDIPWKRELIVEELILSNGKKTLLLFEGYDELPAQIQKDKESILMQIISGNCLPEATILVTSRHSASGFIVKYNRKRISQHIEILGFTKENIQTYINENSKERQSLERYLSCYPHIRTMMYIPLNSVIVVEVYHQCYDKDKPAPKTMTELYTSLVRTLLIRYLSDNSSYKHCTKIIEFTDLPEKVYKQFQQICKTAYRGVANGQELIFYDLPDGFETLGLMQEVHELYVDKGDCVSYNFLHLTIQEYLAAVHLSMQPMDIQIQHFKEKKTESSFEMVLRFLSGLTKFHNCPQQDLSLILEPQDDRYGLSELEPEDDNLSELEPEDDRCEPSKLERQDYRYRTSQLEEDQGLSIPRRLVIRQQSGLNFHWLFEVQNVEYISSVLKKEVFNVDRLSTPFEAYALGYCVAHSNLRWTLSQFTEDSTIMEMLIRGLQAEETQCKGTCYEVKIEINKYTKEFFKPTILIKFFRRITCRITSASFLSGVSTEQVKDMASCFVTLEVNVKDNEMKMEHFENLCELITSSTSLRHFTMDAVLPESVDMFACLEPIVIALGRNTSLDSVFFPNWVFLLAVPTALKRTGRSELYPRVLQLLDVRCNDKEGALFLGKAFVYHPNTTAEYLSPAKIRSLYIYDIPCRYVGDTSFLSDLCNLRKLDIISGDLSGNNIKFITGFLKASDEEARSLVDVEGGSGNNKICTLEHIELKHCHIGPLGAQHLAFALCVNTSSVKTLKLSSNPLGDEGALALAEMLGGNGAVSSRTVNMCTLEHLELSNCSIGPVGVQPLAQALCVNTSVKTLKLITNSLGDEGAKALAEMLGGNGAESSGTVNTTLEHVDLSWCRIGTVGAQHLAQAFCVNTSVKILKLNCNALGDGAKALAEMLGGNGAESSGTVNTTLEHIDLSDCSIGPVGAKHLAQALCVNTSVKTLKFFNQDHYQVKWRDIEENLTEQQKKGIAHRCM